MAPVRPMLALPGPALAAPLPAPPSPAAPALPGPMLDEAVADDPALAPATAPPRNGSPPAAAVARRGALPGADPWLPQPTTQATAATTITIKHVQRTGASSRIRTRSPLVTRYRPPRLRGPGAPAPSPPEGVACAPVPAVAGVVCPDAPSWPTRTGLACPSARSRAVRRG